jgi:chromosomal replication initiation ATPase DnaA
MNLEDPEVVKKVIGWQRELRELTGNHRLVLMPLRRLPNSCLIDIEDLEHIVCDVTGVGKEELSGKCRKRGIVIARHLMAYLGTQLTTLSLSSIGARMNKDHTTIIHGRDNIKDLIDVGDATVCLAISKINAQIEKINSSEPS